MTLESLVYSLSSLSLPINFDDIESIYSLEMVFQDECNDCEFSGVEEYILKNNISNQPIVKICSTWRDGDIENVHVIETYNLFAFETFISLCKEIVSTHVTKQILNQI